MRRGQRSRAAERHSASLRGRGYGEGTTSSLAAESSGGGTPTPARSCMGRGRRLLLPLLALATIAAQPARQPTEDVTRQHMEAAQKALVAELAAQQDAH